MLEVSDFAVDKLHEHLQANNISSPLRVALLSGGCAGQRLGLALDEEKETDESFKKNEITFLVEKILLEQCGSITVDYIEAGAKSGFSISATKPLQTLGSGCNSASCGTGGCSC